MTRRALQPADRSADAPSGVLLWRRIADDLEQSIARGTFEPGSRLPGEIEIAERFGVNRHTVRRALAALAQRGIVRAERGSGTYIERARIPYPIRSRTRFSEIVGGAGHAVGGRLMSHALEEASPDLARRLKLRPGTPLLRLERLRHADRVPLSVASTWLEAARFPGGHRVYATSNSITRMLAHFGIRNYSRKTSRITAAIAEAADAASLRIALGRPLLVVDSVDVDADGVPLLATHTRFPADRLELVVEP